MTSPSPQARDSGRLADAPLVLIVDDNEKNRKLARDVLRAAGLRTLEAGRGDEAISRRDRPSAGRDPARPAASGHERDRGRTRAPQRSRNRSGYRSSRSAPRRTPGAATDSWRRASTAISRSRSTCARFRSRCAASASAAAEPVCRPKGVLAPPEPASGHGRRACVAACHGLDAHRRPCEDRHMRPSRPSWDQKEDAENAETIDRRRARCPGRRAFGLRRLERELGVRTGPAAAARRLRDQPDREDVPRVDFQEGHRRDDEPVDRQRDRHVRSRADGDGERRRSGTSG